MLQIAALAIICAIIVLYLKNINSELYVLALIGSGIILLYTAAGYISQTFDFFNKIINVTGVDGEYFGIIFKIISIGYLIEFAASTIEDFGLKSLADKLVFIGKIIIIGVSMPIIYAVFNLITGLMK